jgi:histidyl-tRNA synthetase
MSSIREPVFKVNNIYTAAKRWKENIRLARDFLEQLSSDKFIEIRYEDLLRNPCDVLSTLIKFLGIKDEDEQVIKNIRKHIFEDVKTDNFNKWKTQLSESQIELYEQVAGDMLKLYSYETKAKPEKKLNFVRKGFWELHNQLSYLANKKVWGENYYKAKFRIKNFMVPLRKTWNQEGNLKR